MKNKKILALCMAFTMLFTSACAAGSKGTVTDPVGNPYPGTSDPDTAAPGAYILCENIVNAQELFDGTKGTGRYCQRQNLSGPYDVHRYR